MTSVEPPPHVHRPYILPRAPTPNCPRNTVARGWFGQGKLAVTMLSELGENKALITHEPKNVRRTVKPWRPVRGSRLMHRTTADLGNDEPLPGDVASIYRSSYSGEGATPVERSEACPNQHNRHFVIGMTNRWSFGTETQNSYPAHRAVCERNRHLQSESEAIRTKQMLGHNMRRLITGNKLKNDRATSTYTETHTEMPLIARQRFIPDNIHPITGERRSQSARGNARNQGSVYNQVPLELPAKCQYNPLSGERNKFADDNQDVVRRVSGNRRLVPMRRADTFILSQ